MYQKEGHFRFEYKDTPEWPTFSAGSGWKPPVIWSDGKDWKHKPGFSDGFDETITKQERQDLRLALQALMEVTLDSSNQIPLLLLPKGKSSVGDYFHGERGSIEKVEKIDNQDCYILTHHNNLVDGRDGKIIKNISDIGSTKITI